MAYFLGLKYPLMIKAYHLTIFKCLTSENMSLKKLESVVDSPREVFVYFSCKFMGTM